MEEKNCLLNKKERPDHRLRKNNQFNYIYKKGERKSSKNFTLFVVKSKYENYKIGYSISKKVGKDGGIITRIAAPKDIASYLNRLPQIIIEKNSLFGSK